MTTFCDRSPILLRQFDPGTKKFDFFDQKKLLLCIVLKASRKALSIVHRSESRQRQYLYFSISTASKLSTCDDGVSEGLGCENALQ